MLSAWRSHGGRPRDKRSQWGAQSMANATTTEPTLLRPPAPPGNRSRKSSACHQSSASHRRRPVRVEYGGSEIKGGRRSRIFRSSPNTCARAQSARVIVPIIDLAAIRQGLTRLRSAHRHHRELPRQVGLLATGPRHVSFETGASSRASVATVGVDSCRSGND